MRSYLLRLRILVCFTIFFAVLGSSCGRETPDKADPNNSEPSSSSIEIEADTNLAEPNAAAEITTDAIAVTVNGTVITEAELEQAMKPQLDAIAKQASASNLPPTFLEQYKKQVKPRILNQLIRGQLLNEKVKEANIVITDEEVINQIKQLLSEQQEPLSLEEFKKKSQERGIDFEYLKDDIRKKLSYQKLMMNLWEGKINVTEEDAKKFYDENLKRFEIPEQIAASHILIKPEPIDPNSDDPNEAIAKSKAVAKEKAQDLLKQIKDGADFAELAKAHSICPSAKDGGNLGFFPRGQMTPPFEEAAFELELGQTSDVVETSYGYHIIQNTGHKDAGVVPFEEAKSSIIKQLAKKQQNEFVEKYMESLKDKANIVYPPGKEPTPATDNP